jgi:hypothetical protein
MTFRCSGRGLPMVLRVPLEGFGGIFWRFIYFNF